MKLKSKINVFKELQKIGVPLKYLLDVEANDWEFVIVNDEIGLRKIGSPYKPHDKLYLRVKDFNIHKNKTKLINQTYDEFHIELDHVTIAFCLNRIITDTPHTKFLELNKHYNVEERSRYKHFRFVYHKPNEISLSFIEHILVSCGFSLEEMKSLKNDGFEFALDENLFYNVGGKEALFIFDSFILSFNEVMHFYKKEKHSASVKEFQKIVANKVKEKNEKPEISDIMQLDHSAVKATEDTKPFLTWIEASPEDEKKIKLSWSEPLGVSGLDASYLPDESSKEDDKASKSIENPSPYELIAETLDEDSVTKDFSPLSPAEIESLERCSLKVATRLYQPVFGTDDTSKYFLVAATESYRMAVRWSGTISIRIEGHNLSDKVSNLLLLGLDIKKVDNNVSHASMHLGGMSDIAAKKVIGSVIGGLSENLFTDFPDLGLIRYKGA